MSPFFLLFLGVEVCLFFFFWEAVSENRWIFAGKSREFKRNVFMDSSLSIPVSPYDVLRCLPTSPYEEIRASYLRLALETHPDKSEGSSSAFQAVQWSWEILSCSKRRASYDARSKSQHGLGSTSSLNEASVLPSEEIFVTDLRLGENGVSTHQCRCGDVYSLSFQEKSRKVDLLPCSGCSLYIKINYPCL